MSAIKVAVNVLVYVQLARDRSAFFSLSYEDVNRCSFCASGGIFAIVSDGVRFLCVFLVSHSRRCSLLAYDHCFCLPYLSSLGNIYS